MHVLPFLRDAAADRTANSGTTFEYRLLCSGELYNKNVLTLDWRKCSAARVLLTQPFELIVAHQPFDDYPQELALRFKTTMVTETKGSGSFIFFPDEEIGADIASLLSLFCRRLVTVSGKVRAVHPPVLEAPATDTMDWPVPIVRSLQRTFWRPRPVTMIDQANGTTLVNHGPAPKQIAPSYLSKMFLFLPRLEHAHAFILSARRYALALELIEQRPDLSYQLLVSSVEAIAMRVLHSFEPSDTEKVSAKQPVYRLAQRYGLTEEQAKQLAIAAWKGSNAARRKFEKFLTDYVTDELWTSDDLFLDLGPFRPRKEGFDKALRQIYKIRSTALHHGYSYPLTAGLGTSPLIPTKMMLEFDSGEEVFPPVTWFERVVNIALRTYVEKMANM